MMTHISTLDESHLKGYQRLEEGSAAYRVMAYLLTLQGRTERPTVIAKETGLTTSDCANACRRLWESGRATRVKDNQYKNRSRYGAA